LEAVLQPVSGRGFDGIGEVLSAVLNFAMLVEREKALGAQPDERTTERGGHANGFKPRTLKTRVGELSLRVPQRDASPNRPRRFREYPVSGIAQSQIGSGAPNRPTCWAARLHKKVKMLGPFALARNQFAHMTEYGMLAPCWLGVILNLKIRYPPMGA